MRFIDMFDRSRKYYPDRTAVACDEKELTYEDCHNASLKLADALVSFGLKVEAKVGIMAPNVSDALPAILGVVRSGCTWLPVNFRNSRDDNVAILTNCDCEWLIYHSEFASEAAALLDAVPSVRGAVCIDKPMNAHPPLSEFIENAGTNPPERGLEPDHCFKMALSGGTTGTPKGVMHTNLNAQIFISSLARAFPHRKPPVFLCCAPVTHAAGNYCMWMLSLGGTIRMMKKTDAGEILSAIETYKVTTTFAPPTVVYQILDHPDLAKTDFSSLEFFFYGAAPISAEKLKRMIEAVGLKMAQVYSVAEATMAMVYMTPEDHDVLDRPEKIGRLRSAGRAAPYTRIEIVDDDGNVLPQGETGEIAVRGEIVSRGYYKKPDETAAMMKKGWLMTSDVGYEDEDGFIYLVDRKRDMIITGGFNVFPSEVEQAITQIDAVHDVAVIGVPDEEWGEAIMAVIALNEGAELTADEVIAHCKPIIGSVKTPKRVEFRSKLPKSANGKVLKRALREESWKNRGARLTA